MKNLSLSPLLSITLVGSSVSGFVFLSLFDAAIKSCLLIFIAAIVCSLVMSKVSASVRHVIWAATLMAVVAMPAFALLLPEMRVLPHWISVENQLSNETGLSNLDVDRPDEVISEPVSSVVLKADLPETAEMQTVATMPSIATSGASAATSSIESKTISINADMLIGVWAIGFFLCMLPALISFFRLKLLERTYRSKSADDHAQLRALVADVARNFGMKPPCLLVGEAGAMPMVWSFGKPMLLLPQESLQWTKARICSVLLHELVHLRRRDPLVCMLGMLAWAMNWFNPLAWYAVSALRAECERACDDCVLRSGIAPDEYATDLLHVATNQKPVIGAGTLAFAMAGSPKIENRISSILDQGLNRHSVGWRCTASLIVLFAAMAAGLASLSASTLESGNANLESEMVEEKWPYCVVETESLEPRSLESAISRFNKDAMQSPIGKKQEPISLEETITAINESVKLDHVSDEVKDTLRGVLESEELPSNCHFRRFTRYDDGNRFHGVWWVRLVVKTSQPTFYSVPIRTETIYSRRHTQFERKQHRDGLTLLGRFSSYYESTPIGCIPKPLDAGKVEELISKVNKAIAEKDKAQLMALFHSEGASESTRKFSESEVEQLLRSEVHSVRHGGVTLSGNLLHWSGYQNYKPNLAVIGYLDFVYSPKNGDSASKTLSFEMGNHNDQFRLINYVADGQTEWPKGEVKHSNSSHNELLSDGTCLSTSITTNPGTLLSAHLANEEIWLHDLTTNKEKIDIEDAVDPEADSADDPVFQSWSAEQEKSKRVVQILQRLGGEAKLRVSSHARDVPDLYKPDPENEGRFIRREGTLGIGDAFNEQGNDKELITFTYSLNANVFYMRQRFKWSDPHHDRIFGPFEGNPLDRFPEIEKQMLVKMADGDSNPQIVMRRIMRLGNAALNARVVNLVDQSLDSDIPDFIDRNTLVRSLEGVLEINRPQVVQESKTNELLATRLASIQRKLGEFKDQRDRLTLSFPDEDYVTSDQTSQAAPEDISDSLWGESVDGLRFAVVPESTELELDKQVKVSLVVENTTTDRDIKITVHDLVQDVRPEVGFKGKPVLTRNTWFSGWPPTNRYLIKPGERFVLAKSTLVAFKESKRESEFEVGFGSTGIPVSQATIDDGEKMDVGYRLDIGMNESWSRGEDGVMRVYSPAKGEWTGRLSAGGFRIGFGR